MRGSRRVIGSVGLIALLGLAGCGGGSDDASPSGDTGPPTSATATIEPTGPARDFSRAGVAVIAHRGASAYAPEHTSAAYTKAIEQEADYIELDVQRTSDGEFIVMHDPSLDRTARGPAQKCAGFVSDHTMADLDACDVGTWFNEAHPDLADPSFGSQRILTLADLFDDYGDETRYYLEVKDADADGETISDLLALIDDAGIVNDDPVFPNIVIQSFSAPVLQTIHQERPDLPLVQLIRQGEPVPDADALDEIATYAVAIGPPKEMTTRDLVEAASERCLDTHPYTVDESAEMASLLDAGVGALFTNAPDVLRKLLPDEPRDTGLCPATATADS
ncbi:MAG: glycerophosphodiester phosphodiesterase family protein [Aquihabitans sp.]